MQRKRSTLGIGLQVYVDVVQVGKSVRVKLFFCKYQGVLVHGALVVKYLMTRILNKCGSMEVSI